MNAQLWVFYLHICGVLLLSINLLYKTIQINTLGKLKFKIGNNNKLLKMIMFVVFFTLVLIPLRYYTSEVMMLNFFGLEKLDILKVNTLIGALRGIFLLILLLQLMVYKYRQGEIRERGIFLNNIVLTWEEIDSFRFSDENYCGCIVFTINRRKMFNKSKKTIEWNVEKEYLVNIIELLIERIPHN